MHHAGHLPTMHFDRETWQAMQVWAPRDAGEMAPDGFSRTIYGGKPIVVFHAPYGSGLVSFAVRPIVRVPMRRREMTWPQMILADWWNSRPRRIVSYETEKASRSRDGHLADWIRC